MFPVLLMLWQGSLKVMIKYSSSNINKMVKTVLNIQKSFRKLVLRFTGTLAKCSQNIFFLAGIVYNMKCVAPDSLSWYDTLTQTDLCFFQTDGGEHVRVQCIMGHTPSVNAEGMDGFPKNENPVIIYSPSSCSEPLWVFVFCWMQNKMWRMLGTKQSTAATDLHCNRSQWPPSTNWLPTFLKTKKLIHVNLLFICYYKHAYDVIA